MRKTLWALLLLPLLTTPACDSSEDKDTIYGVWEWRGSDEGFYVISSSKITVYDYRGDTVDNGDDCYSKLSLTLESLGDDEYQLSGASDPITITRSGDVLTFSANGDSERYDLSSKKESDLKPLC